MGARELAVVVLLGLAALIVVFCGLGLLTAPRGLARVHFMTPVTSIARPLTGIAYIVTQGPGLSGGLGLFTAFLVAVSGPPLGAAIGRATANAEELLPEAEQ